MDMTVIEGLLYREESDSLDFKQQQYAFVGADDIRKSELLKDILAFANSWCKGDSHILIGVEEIKGGKCNVLGINNHIDDATLQQFVNSKTNQPISFSYMACPCEGKTIGVICIHSAHRPVYLKNKFGRLEPNAVYIRRGSSTDIALPDEIARMGESRAKNKVTTPVLEVQFGILKSRKLIGREVTYASPDYQIGDDIPRYAGEFGDNWLSVMERENPDYYYEAACYLAEVLRLLPLGFVVKNSSPYVATNVHLEFNLNRKHGLILFDDYQLPEVPSKKSFNPIAGIRSIHDKPDVVIEKYNESYRVNVSLGAILPGQQVWSKYNAFFGTEIGELACSLEGSIFCTEKESQPVNLQVNLELRNRCALPNGAYEFDLDEVVDMLPYTIQEDL